MLFEITKDLVKDPYFNFAVFCTAVHFGFEFTQEFEDELIDMAGIEYDFVTTCL